MNDVLTTELVLASHIQLIPIPSKIAGIGLIPIPIPGIGAALIGYM